MGIQSSVLMPFLLIMLLCIDFSGCSRGNAKPICIGKERDALLKFKTSLNVNISLLHRRDDLLTWVGKDCCNWSGIICNNKTGHVKELLLLENGLVGMIPTSLCTLSSLRILFLVYNQFNGSIPACLGVEQKQLVGIHLSDNQLTGSIPSSFSTLPALKYLGLSRNHLSGPIPICLASGSPSLEVIDLASNQLSGSIPSSIGKLSNLIYLYLDSNRLNGSIPISVGQLLNLEALYLTNNSFTGVVSHTLFKKLTKLDDLSIGGDSLIFDAPLDWIPPFQLDSLDLSSCQVGPRFPLWLQTQKDINEIQISNASISDSMPNWIWNFSSNLYSLVLSNNLISGSIPQHINDTLPNLNVLDLSNNLISGSIPQHINDTLPNLNVLDLSNNSMTGSIPTSLFKIQSLEIIDLSKNHLYGNIPKNGWSNLTDLTVLSLASNKLSGTIPNSTCGMSSSGSGLHTLLLSNNNLYGEIPLSLRTCTNLSVLDFGENILSGNIPSWIEDLSSLEILKLRSNTFEGKLNPKLCNMDNLRVLDLGHNKFSGSIPRCFKNLRAMKIHVKKEIPRYFDSKDIIMQVLKGKELEYTKNLKYLVNLDLSSNYLVGQIPEELTSLLELLGFNLSNNYLTGEIPKSIGNLESLESLDLSHNHLSGIISPSIAHLSYVADLDISYNNLSGQIPTGGQLQTFDASSFEGNEDLCGVQIQKSCIKDDEPINASKSDGGMKEENTGFYFGMIIGFVIGFWIVGCTLFFKNTWRYAHYRIVENTYDRIALIYIGRVSRLRQRFK